MKRHRVTGRSPTGNRPGGPGNGNAVAGVGARNGEYKKEAAKLQGGYYPHPVSDETLAVVAQAVEGDRRFFSRHLGRTMRIRIASAAEVIQFGAPPPPFGLRYFLLVRQVKPGKRLRLPFICYRDAETDVSEARCAAIYEAVAADAQS